MTSDQRFDIFTDDVPQEWLDAEAEAPRGEGGVLKKSAALGVMPVAISLDLFSAIVAGLAAGLLAGCVWFLAETNGLASPLWAMPVAAAVTVAVRVGGGRPDPLARTALSLALYLMALTTVGYLTAERTFVDLYGVDPSLNGLEQELLYRQLRDPLTVSAWLGGVLLTALISHRTTRR
ncbi:MAG: hypothetical protein ACFCVK_06530 [Acidimicrobiales bacterium]